MDNARYEHVKRTWNVTEHCEEVHLVQAPTILVFQSVALGSNWQVVLPPLEMVVQGFFVPGKFATVQPGRIGTSHLCCFSPLAMPKLQNRSVVACESSGMPWAQVESGTALRKNRAVHPPAMTAAIKNMRGRQFTMGAS